MVIKQRPQAINFLGSLPDLVMASSTAVEITVSAGSNLLAKEIYEASPQGEILVRLKEIVKYAFEIWDFNLGDIPYDVLKSANLQSITVSIGDSQQLTFAVINGQATNRDSYSFLEKEFVNTCGQVKTSTLSCVEILNLYAPTAGLKLKCDCHLRYTDEIPTLDLFTLPAGLLMLPISFRAILNMLPDGTELEAVDVYVDKEGFCGQRYLFEDPGFTDDFFYFENSLGGIDLIRFTGDKTDKRNYQSLIIQQGESTVDYDNEATVTFVKNTGYLSTPLEKEFARDFLRSDKRYHIIDGHPRRIYIVKGEVEATDNALANFSFEFHYESEDMFVTMRTAMALPVCLDELDAVMQDNELYRLMLLVEKLRRDLDDFKDYTEEELERLKDAIDAAKNSAVHINDTTPSTTTAYSSSKIEEIRQLLGNLWPFKTAGTSGREVKIKELMALTNVSLTARQILPMVACAGTLDKQSYDGEPLIRYGPTSWYSVGVYTPRWGWVITHNLGHQNYIFIGNVQYRANDAGQLTRPAATVMIREKTDNNITVYAARGNGSEPEIDLPIDFVIFTFTDPRNY